MTHRILIVEDEALIGLDLASALEDEGFEVVGIARDMFAALRMAADGGVDLATMDVQLACDTNGVDTALQLRDLHAIPSIFVSGSLDQSIRSKAAAARPIGFLDKPVNAEVVAHFVKDHFDSLRA